LTADRERAAKEDEEDVAIAEKRDRARVAAWDDVTATLARLPAASYENASDHFLLAHVAAWVADDAELWRALDTINTLGGGHKPRQHKVEMAHVAHWHVLSFTARLSDTLVRRSALQHL
jgi:hypothetical protein